jgi:hypothetical protein
VKLHAAGLPQLQGDAVSQLQQAHIRSYIDQSIDFMTSEEHYYCFESVMTGRDCKPGRVPSDSYRKMFVSKLLKDACIATKMTNLLQQYNSNEDFFVVLCDV